MPLPIELDIECRLCGWRFKRFLSDTPTDVTIRCPLCYSFALAIIDDFSQGKQGYTIPPALKKIRRGKRKKA